MLQIFIEYPWLAAVALAMLVPITAILVAVPMDNWRKVRVAELDASLKQAMLERGMSAEDIAMVINTQSKPSKKRDCGFARSVQNMNAQCQGNAHSSVL